MAGQDAAALTAELKATPPIEQQSFSGQSQAATCN